MTNREKEEREAQAAAEHVGKCIMKLIHDGYSDIRIWRAKKGETFGPVNQELMVDRPTLLVTATNHKKRDFVIGGSFTFDLPKAMDDLFNGLERPEWIPPSERSGE